MSGDPYIVSHRHPPEHDGAAGSDQAVLEAAEAFPRGACRNYALEVARLTLSGARAHAERAPATGLSGSKAASIRTAIDAALDREACSRLAAGDRVTVRCADDVERTGVIESFGFGASAPITVRVDYPDGFTEQDGYGPINPANYALGSVVR